MLRKIFIIFTFIGACAFIKSEDKDLKCHKSYTPEQLKEDLLILTTTLKEIHPDLYRVNSRSAIEKKIKEIQSSLESEKSYLEFLKLIAPLFTDIGCINTQWGHSAEFIKFRNDKIPVFPFQLKIENNKFYIQNNFSNTAIEPGTEIIKINGETMEDYLKKNYGLLPTDGKIKTVRQRWLEANFPQHHANFWEQPDTFNLEIKDKTGKVSESAVRSLLRKQMQSKKNSANVIVRPKKFYIADNIGVLTIPSFKESNVNKFTAFMDSCFTVLQKQNTKNLIINLKGEGSGNIYFGAILLSYLTNETFKYTDEIKSKTDSITYKKNVTYFSSPAKELDLLSKEVSPKKNNFNGKLFIVTDGWTINAKAYFCCKALKRANTFFAGEECGASTFGINEFPVSLKLPNTGILVFIPTNQLVVDRKNYKSEKGIKVDFPIAETENDLVISKTIEMIKKKGE